ncbi:MAG: exopolysaccharide biosynthesis polyprenyl glycosylphosphotransferase [Gammaproteobacteria bacterium]
MEVNDIANHNIETRSKEKASERFSPGLDAGTSSPNGDGVRPGVLNSAIPITAHHNVSDRTSSLQTKLLPKPHFLTQLGIEKRRAERSKAPLSIALFYFDPKKSDELNNFDEFVTPFQGKLRETDIIGYVGHEIIGLIFPDTNASGAQQCIRKIFNGHERPPFSIVTATYPDDLFNRLPSEKREPGELPPLFFEDSTELRSFRYRLKRSVDIVGALFAILLSSPFLLITALVIKLNSPGPVIFKQVRLGRKGVPFTFYKFRSMYRDADDRIHREYIARFINGRNEETKNDEDMEKPLYKIKSDPRVTRIGRIIRTTSIDELPQLFNVLKGDMSLVGPRPPLPYEAEQYQSWHLRRILEMKPGITGLWQVEGRSKTSFDDMVRLDLRYIRNWSIMFDLKILIKTVKVVIQSTGAL